MSSKWTCRDWRRRRSKWRSRRGGCSRLAARGARRKKRRTRSGTGWRVAAVRSCAGSGCRRMQRWRRWRRAWRMGCSLWLCPRTSRNLRWKLSRSPVNMKVCGANISSTNMFWMYLLCRLCDLYVFCGCCSPTEGLCSVSKRNICGWLPLAFFKLGSLFGLLTLAKNRKLVHLTY